MLRELKIRNFAIIDDLSIRFDQGLNALTGETGAGKSIVVDALGVALGSRSQQDLVRTGEKEASVQAFFDDAGSALPEDLDIDASDGVLIRRIITSAGKSRAYINDTMVTLQTLSKVGNALVDLMGQHEHQGLLRTDRQRQLLDDYGKLAPQRTRVENLSQTARRLRSSEEELRQKAQERSHRIDLLKFQVQEIGSAELTSGEEESLTEEKLLLSNLQRLNELVSASYGLLYSEDGACTDRISGAEAMLRELAEIDPGLKEPLGLLESARPLVEDASLALREALGRYDLDPARLEAVEERLELIRKLQKKYGRTVRDVLEYAAEADAELKGLESSDEMAARIEKEALQAELALHEAAEELTAARKKVAQKLERLVTEAISGLALDKAGFRISIEEERDDSGATRITGSGKDRIEFLFSANPGETVRPLARIASGGELSRVMLGIKSVFAAVDDTPVLVFDEVDAGIGGKTAEYAGQKLASLARKHQVICITHLAQIARHADQHLRIEKKQAPKKVSVEVHQLQGKERQEEIARMLSGEVTEISRQHAEELLGRT